MYDPTLGRFLERDPAGGGADDAFLYTYVSDDPLHDVDPTGMVRLPLPNPNPLLPVVVRWTAAWLASAPAPTPPTSILPPATADLQGPLPADSSNYVNLQVKYQSGVEPPGAKKFAYGRTLSSLNLRPVCECQPKGRWQLRLSEIKVDLEIQLSTEFNRKTLAPEVVGVSESHELKHAYHYYLWAKENKPAILKDFNSAITFATRNECTAELNRLWSQWQRVFDRYQAGERGHTNRDWPQYLEREQVYEQRLRNQGIYFPTQ